MESVDERKTRNVNRTEMSRKGGRKTMQILVALRDVVQLHKAIFENP